MFQVLVAGCLEPGCHLLLRSLQQVFDSRFSDEQYSHILRGTEWVETCKSRLYSVNDLPCDEPGDWTAAIKMREQELSVA